MQIFLARERILDRQVYGTFSDGIFSMVAPQPPWLQTDIRLLNHPRKSEMATPQPRRRGDAGPKNNA